MAASDDNARIADYWERRPGLTEAEWVDLYRRVTPLLLRTRLPDEYNEKDKRLELVNDFFQDKILINAETTKAGPLASAHALHGYLKNYVLDRLRKEPDPEPLPESVDGWMEDAAHTPMLTEAQLLREAGIDIQAALDSADRFIANALDDGDRAYLRHASCADGKPEPVSGIAKRMELGSVFHLKARKLGITRKKGETYRGYEKTKIGGWLLSTGAKLQPDWCMELAALLTLLCQRVRLNVRK
jgi:hypothetical protein